MDFEEKLLTNSSELVSRVWWGGGGVGEWEMGSRWAGNWGVRVGKFGESYLETWSFGMRIEHCGYPGKSFFLFWTPLSTSVLSSCLSWHGHVGHWTCKQSVYAPSDVTPGLVSPGGPDVRLPRDVTPSVCVRIAHGPARDAASENRGALLLPRRAAYRSCECRLRNSGVRHIGVAAIGWVLL